MQATYDFKIAANEVGKKIEKEVRPREYSMTVCGKTNTMRPITFHPDPLLRTGGEVVLAGAERIGTLERATGKTANGNYPMPGYVLKLTGIVWTGPTKAPITLKGATSVFCADIDMPKRKIDRALAYLVPEILATDETSAAGPLP
ncbi:hypothetical protein [Variovorax paradoxus]|jgi:hypothetical protein|uniref:hypothetical protein n=1 Tax=Variovorax paradoxus TaxID=34073 RepID=UPI003D64E92A